MAMSTDFKAMSKMNINPGLSIITEREELDNMAESNSAVPLSGNDVSSNHSDDFGPKNGKMSHVGKTMMGEDRKVKEKLRKTLLTGKSEAQIRKEERLEQIRAKRDQEEAERLAEEAERLAKIEWKRKKRLAKEAAAATARMEHGTNADIETEVESEDSLFPSEAAAPSRTKTMMLHSSQQAHENMRDKLLELEQNYKTQVKKETTYQRYAREKMERKHAQMKAEAEARKKAKEAKRAEIWIPKVGDRCLARYKAREDYLPCKIIAITKEIPVIETPTTTRRQSLFGTPKSRNSAPSTPLSTDGKPSEETLSTTKKHPSLFDSSKSRSTAPSTLTPTAQVTTPKDRHADYAFPSPKAAAVGVVTGGRVSPLSSQAISPKSNVSRSMPPSPSGSVGSSIVSNTSDAQDSALLRFTVHYDHVAEHHLRGRKKKIEGLDEIEEGLRLDLLAPPRNPHHYIKPVLKDLKLSIADKHKAYKDKSEKMKKMRDMKVAGPKNALKRNKETIKKVWLMEQGPDKIRKMEVKKKWKEIGEANKKERRRLQRLAAFRYWGEEEQFKWLRHALLVSFKTLHSILESRKNSKQKLDAHSLDYLNVLSAAFFQAEDKIFDKIGRNMSEVKYRDSRLIKDRDIQRAKNRPLSKVEEYLTSTKGTVTAATSRPGTGLSSPPRTATGSPNGRRDVPTAATNKSSESERIGSPARSERAHSPQRGMTAGTERTMTAGTERTMTAGFDDNVTNSEYVQKHHKPPAQILEELRHEYEVEVHRAFNFFAERLADHFGKSKRKNTNRMMVVAIDFCAIASHETINNSKFLRILPQQHKELKLLELRSKNMAKQYDRLYFACTQFASEIGVVDKAWGRHLAVMLSQSILQKYDSEEPLREKGRNIAANRISSIFQMNRFRKILKSVYAQLEVLEQEAIQRNAILLAEKEARERKEREEKERKAALAERRKIVGDGAVVYVAEDSLTALLNHRPVKEFKNTRPLSPSRSRPSTSYELEHATNSPFYRMDVNICFSQNGLALRLDGNIKIRCIILRNPTRRQTRSLPKEERRKKAKWGGAKLEGAGTIGRSLHTSHTADVNNPHYHHNFDGGEGNHGNNKKEKGVRRTVYESGRLLLLVTPEEWKMPDYGFEEILVHATWHKRSHGGAAIHLANSYDPNSNPDLLALSEEKTARMCYVTVELKDLPRDMEYRLHCMIHSSLISQEPWPPIPKYKLRKHEEPAVYSFLSAPAIPVMQNAQKPFLTDKNRVSQLTNETDILDMFLRLQQRREKEEEMMSELEFGDNNENDGNSVGEQSISDMGSMNDHTVYSTDDEMIREAIEAETALRKWQQRQKNEETNSIEGIESKDENDSKDDDSEVGLVRRQVCQVDDFFDEINECAESGKGLGFLVSFHTDPTHPDRPRMKPPDVRLEMGGVGLDKVFISSSSSKKSEHFIIVRILWSMGYTGGLPVDEYELYRRIDTGGEMKQSSSSSSSSSASSSSSSLASSAASFVTAASTAPWELVSQSLENSHLEMLPVAMFHPLMEQQVQFQEEYGIKSKVHGVYPTQMQNGNSNVDCEEEDEFSVEKIKEMESEGIRVVEIPRARFVGRCDKYKTIHPKKAPLVRLQFKVRAHNRCGWGHFSKPVTFLVKPQREEFSIDRISSHGLGSGLMDEVRERLKTLSRGGSPSGKIDSDDQVNDADDEIDYSDMLSRPPTAHVLEEEEEHDVDGIVDRVDETGEEEGEAKGEDEEGKFDFEIFLQKMAELTPMAKLKPKVYM